MSDFFNLPVGKRTRHQRLFYAQGLYGIDESLSCGSSKNRDKKRNREIEFSESEDSDEVIEIEDDEINNKGSNGAGRSTKRKLDKAIKDEKSPSDGSDSEEEQSDENGSGDNTRSSESDESTSDESWEDNSDGEECVESDDPSKSNEVDRSSSSESEEDKSDEKGFDGTKSRTYGSSSGYGQDDIEIIDVDDYWINRKGYKGSSSSTKREPQEAKPVHKSVVNESGEEQSNEDGSGVRSTSVDLEISSVDLSTEGGRKGQEGTDTAAVAKNEKTECYGSAAESGSDDMVVSDDEEEGSEDPSRLNEVDKSSRSELQEDESDEKGFDNTKLRTFGSSSGYGQDDIEFIDLDDYWNNRKGSKGSSSSTKRKTDEAKPVNRSLVDVSEEEQTKESGSGVRSTSVDLEKSSVDLSTKGGRKGEEGTDTAAVAKNKKKECCGSANESDSDDMVVSYDDEEGLDDPSRLYEVDESSSSEPEEDKSDKKGSKRSSSSTKGELDEGKPADRSLVDESEEEQNNKSGSGVPSTSVELEQSPVDVSSEDDCDAEEGTDTAAAAKNEKKECYGSAKSLKCGTHTYFYYSSDEPDSDDIVVSDEEEEEKVRSINSKEKGRSVKQEMDDLIDTHEKENAKGKEKGPQASNIGRRKDVGGRIDTILDSITIDPEDDVQEKEGEGGIPLKFRFAESDDESASPITDESDAETLFQEMNFELQSEEIGSSINLNAGNQDNDGSEDHFNATTHFNCKRGNHGDIYLEEQTGLRCCLCGAIILESRYVIPKLANYAPDRQRRGYHSSEQQFLNTEDAYFHYSDGKPREICMQTKGTVWELIPNKIQGELYPHQQEGFKFLWENLAGTIELQELQKLGPCGGGSGGGCIISHAPGTGKTLLTIVFIESFLKKFPKCYPLIMVPSNMLDTWEAEFKKWKVGFSFINLNTTDSLSKEMNISSRNNKDYIRALKIKSWCDGGSVLGVSYSLYEKIIGDTKRKIVNLEKMGNLLLDKPGLVILDEGHTPRSKKSNTWNILLKLKTKNRVILSGTPFQNNFQELFNTLRLVRPETATDIENDKIFADMSQRKNKNKSTSMSPPEDIEKLKKIIAPFVNVHKVDILERKLPGLKQSIVLLNPPPLQKGLINNLDKLSGTFEYEHKVALVSVHPSLILSCQLTENEEKLTNKQELEKVRLHPDVGVKTRLVLEIIRLSESLDEKVLIFSQYTAPLHLLKDQIAHVFSWVLGREIMLINGRTHQKLRKTIINDFNDPNSKSKVLLASIKCCSEGIHLIGASRVVLLDIVWNPSVDTQAISRAYRLGQKKVVYTYHLMTAGTTEEEKYDTQVEKGRLAEMVFSSSASEDPKSSASKDVIELNDMILGKLVDHPDMKEIFKKIWYP